jgi:hypothetical protein
MNANPISIAEIAVAVVGLGMALLTNRLSDRKMDEKIERKIIEALAKRN